MAPGLIGSAYESGNVVFWDLNAKKLTKLKVHVKSRAKKVAFSYTSSLTAASAAIDGTISIIGLDKMKYVHILYFSPYC